LVWFEIVWFELVWFDLADLVWFDSAGLVWLAWLAWFGWQGGRQISWLVERLVVGWDWLLIFNSQFLFFLKEEN
jgi:hypothetical protein